MKGLDLKGDTSRDDLFPVQEDIVLTQATPGPGISFQSVGTIRSFVGESVVPVVANVHGEDRLRCVGTGFFVSCTGLLLTAAHVITDPIERKYGGVTEHDDVTWLMRQLNFGVLVRTNPIFLTSIPILQFAKYPADRDAARGRDGMASATAQRSNARNDQSARRYNRKRPLFPTYIIGG